MDLLAQDLMGSTHRVVVFDAVVRTGSFTKAAHLLGVSQPAVSRQIAILEDHLQAELFRREGNGVVLTAAAESLHAHVHRALTELDEGVRAARGTDVLTVAVQPAIADSWFSPRLSELRDALSPTIVRLVIYDLEDELRSLQHDVSIRFGDSFGSNNKSLQLVQESVVPVASPELAARLSLSPASAASALSSGPPLLQLDSAGRDWLTWQEWFGHFEISWQPPEGEIVQRSYGVLVQQALSGRGVVLGWNTLLGDLVTRGLLTVVGPKVERPAKAYHLVWPKGISRSVGLRRLRSWITQTIDEL